MRKGLVPPCAIVLGVCLLAGNAMAQRRRVSTNVNDRNQAITDCRQIQIEFDRKDAITEEDQLTIPQSQISTLQIRPSSNSGVYVTGWDGSDYIVKTCKAVPAGDSYLANQTLREISTTNAGGRVSVVGPANSDWVAYLLIQAPRRSSLDLESANGPVSFRDLNGRIQARAANGPVSLTNINGDVDVTATNGPIHLAGGSGNQRVNATNGPMHVELTGNRWEGAGLEANTHNGPLTVNLPDFYSSGVRIDTPRHSPVSCRVTQCSQAVRRSDSPNVIELGGVTAVVRLAATNGPVSIQPAR